MSSVLHQDGTGNHHDRQMDGQQNGEGDQPLIPDGPPDERQADEDIVGKGRGYAGYDGDATILLEDVPRDDMPNRPGYGHAGEIGQPQPEGRCAMKIRLRKSAEDQSRHGDLEYKIAENLTGISPEQAGLDGEPADQDKNENRSDVRGNGRHGGKAFAAFAGDTPL
ncbi:hypothetical protein D3C87_1480030 [compost metagenome]